MAPLPMRCLIEQVIGFPRAATVRLTGPAELDLTVLDQAEFVMCHHTIELDHRGVQRIARPMLGFKAFVAARGTLVGICLMHMPRKCRWWSRREKKTSHPPNSSTLWPLTPIDKPHA